MASRFGNCGEGSGVSCMHHRPCDGLEAGLYVRDVANDTCGLIMVAGDIGGKGLAVWTWLSFCDCRRRRRRRSGNPASPSTCVCAAAFLLASLSSRMDCLLT